MIRGKHSKGPQRRHRALERTLLIAELISPLRNGATASQIAVDVCDILGEPYHRRTILRSLEMLVEFGIVERVGVPGGNCSHGGDQYLYRWIAGSLRASACEQMAEAVSLRRDALQLEDAVA